MEYFIGVQLLSDKLSLIHKVYYDDNDDDDDEIKQISINFY